MKKLYKKGTVHPSPPQINKSDDPLLLLLPSAIFSLAAVLSPEDREVLAYLISTASYNPSSSRLRKTKPQHKKTNNHSPLFGCDCFSCYTSYWVRWDESPSRQLIHEIIEAFEDSLEKKKTKKKDRRKQRSSSKSSVLSSSCLDNDEFKIPSQLSESVTSSCPLVDGGGLESTQEVFYGGDGGEVVEEVEEEEKGSGSVRRFVSFIGEKVFGVWG